MKLLRPLLAASILVSSAAYAQPVDLIGGPDSSTQTIHHCGYTATTSKRYTTSFATVRIVERKLKALGYGGGNVDGVYGTLDKKAVRKFQSDYGLQVDGIVGPITAQRLAYASHPGMNVHRCGKLASALR